MVKVYFIQVFFEIGSYVLQEAQESCDRDETSGLSVLNRGAPCPEICEWSPWIDVSRPLYGPDSGDYETYDNIRAHGIEVCTNPLNISCRAVKYPPSKTPCPEICEWSPWIDVSRPLYGPDSGDYETYDNIRAHGIEVCTNPLNISCRAVKYPALSFQELGQKVKCDVSIGLVCENRDQVPGPVMPDSVCLNYEVTILEEYSDPFVLKSVFEHLGKGPALAVAVAAVAAEAGIRPEARPR
ncbi:UNVERIFIED_CONTAM: hypothetical protein K2H54_004334 [Gekko kuhli]